MYPRCILSPSSIPVLPAGVSTGLQWEQHLAGFRSGWFPEHRAPLGLPNGKLPLHVQNPRPLPLVLEVGFSLSTGMCLGE